MIARDAAISLRAALESAKPFMDEMVVVDTGSVDDTKRVAEDLGARVFDFAWCDDFSAARNFSIEQARGGWIFWMDADDVLPAESGRELRRLVGEHPQRDAAFWVAVEEEMTDPAGGKYLMAHGHAKLFPRRAEIRFRYRVHEQVAPAIRALGLPLKVSRAKVQHANADRSPEADAARMQRNLRLLQLDAAERPDDPFVLSNLGKTYLYLPDGPLKAVEYLQRSLERFEPGTSTRLNAYLFLGQAYAWCGKGDTELATYLAAQREYPDDAALLLRLGSSYQQRGDLATAAHHLGKLLQSGRRRVGVIHPPDLFAQGALLLGRICIQHGNPQQAEQLWRNFLVPHPEADEVRQALETLSTERERGGGDDQV
jgi:hypothetical protein